MEHAKKQNWFGQISWHHAFVTRELGRSELRHRSILDCNLAAFIEIFSLIFTDREIKEDTKEAILEQIIVALTGVRLESHKLRKVY